MPGDKSISHRAAMVAALANGVSQIENYATAADCAATLLCLRQLGVEIEKDGNGLTVHGVGANGLRRPAVALDCANSGTTMRLMAGILAGQSFESVLTGDKSLRSRPMQRIIEPLELMGAKLSSLEGRPPLTIRGPASLRAIEYQLPVASAQVKSSILLAGLNAAGRTKVVEEAPTRDHTERMLRWFGVNVEAGKDMMAGHTFAALSGPTNFRARDIRVPGDISSAAYFIAAAALLAGSSLQIADVLLNPTRTAFVEILQTLGCDIALEHSHEESGEPVGSIHVRGFRVPRLSGRLRAELQTKAREVETFEGGTSPFAIKGIAIPKLIDELPLLAVVGSQLRGGIEIRDAQELRVKESDRIATTVAGLLAMGADVEEFADGLRVHGPVQLRGASIKPQGDHRIAMAFTVAGLVAEGETEIEEADCVTVSFPEFFELLDSVVEAQHGPGQL